MTQTLQNDLTTRCKANVSLDTADRLDRGESPVPLYRALAAKGWLGYANIGKDPDNLYHLAEVCKIINSYSGTLGNMSSVNAACAMMLGKFGGAGHQRLAGEILAGKKLAAFALTEPQASTDIQGIAVEGRPTGDQ